MCLSCAEGVPRDECPVSAMGCGHHCNHSWTHDECCWCGAVFSGEEQNEAYVKVLMRVGNATGRVG